MRSVAIIPARLRSTRFPEKPLAPILGQPMIVRVATIAAQALGRDHTYVATDDARIAEVVEAAGYAVVQTSPDALTGTDRVAEAAQSIDADCFINVQGDEPMLAPESIQSVAEAAQQYPEAVINAYAPIEPPEDPHDPNLPKCVMASDGRLLYLSRAALPAGKSPSQYPQTHDKQVCVYAFRRSHLEVFATFGGKAPCEQYEDIEILRFLDLGVTVRMIRLPGNTIAVDRPEDVARVEAALQHGETCAV
ncbi:MAG: 3-deoxy-manno-octulosonate cytidylyltransferase [Opitutales bacterium]